MDLGLIYLFIISKFIEKYFAFDFEWMYIKVYKRILVNEMRGFGF